MDGGSSPRGRKPTKDAPKQKTVYSFGRAVSKSASPSKASTTPEHKFKGSWQPDPEHFEFESAPMITDDPFYLQGDPEYDSLEKKRDREKLKKHQRLQKAIRQFWDVFPVAERGYITQTEYVAMVTKINKALVVGFTHEEAVKLAKEEWIEDAQGQSKMDYKMFFEAMFTLVDLWTLSLNGEEYVGFLNQLFQRITVKTHPPRRPGGASRTPSPARLNPSKQKPAIMMTPATGTHTPQEHEEPQGPQDATEVTEELVTGTGSMEMAVSVPQVQLSPHIESSLPEEQTQESSEEETTTSEAPAEPAKRAPTTFSRVRVPDVGIQPPSPLVPSEQSSVQPENGDTAQPEIAEPMLTPRSDAQEILTARSDALTPRSDDTETPRSEAATPRVDVQPLEHADSASTVSTLNMVDLGYIVDETDDTHGLIASLPNILDESTQNLRSPMQAFRSPTTGFRSPASPFQRLPIDARKLQSPASVSSNTHRSDTRVQSLPQSAVLGIVQQHSQHSIESAERKSVLPQHIVSEIRPRPTRPTLAQRGSTGSIGQAIMMNLNSNTSSQPATFTPKSVSFLPEDQLSVAAPVSPISTASPSDMLTTPVDPLNSDVETSDKENTVRSVKEQLSSGEREIQKVEERKIRLSSAITSVQPRNRSPSPTDASSTVKITGTPQSAKRSAFARFLPDADHHDPAHESTNLQATGASGDQSPNVTAGQSAWKRLNRHVKSHQQDWSTPRDNEHVVSAPAEVARNMADADTVKARIAQMSVIKQATSKVTGMGRLATGRQILKLTNFVAQYKPTLRKAGTLQTSWTLPPPLAMNDADLSAVPEDLYESDEEVLDIPHTLNLLLVGKPGSGKTTIAEQLQTDLGIVHINTAIAIKHAISSQSDLGRESDDVLRSGGALTAAQEVQAVSNMMHSPEVAFRGYVLEDLPRTADEAFMLFPEGNLISSVIEIQVSDEECAYRLSNRRTEKSKIVRDPLPVYLPKVVEATEAVVEVLAEEVTVEKAEGGEEGEDNEPEPEPAEEQQEEEPPVEEEEPIDYGPHFDGAYYPIKQVDDFVPNFDEQQKAYKERTRALRSFLQLWPLIKINGEQPVSDVSKTIHLSLNRPRPIQMPHRLSLPEDTDLDGDLITPHLLIEDAAPRQLSSFGKYCPVEYTTKHKLVLGNGLYAALYKSRVFVFATEFNLMEFMVNPVRYFETPLAVPAQRILVIGPPSSGKTLQIANLTQQYNWPSFTSESVLKSLTDQVTDSLRTGEVLSSTDFITALHSHMEREGVPVPGVGWIIDGIPSTPEEAQSLLAVGLQPSSIIVMKDESDGDILRERAQKIHFDEEITGKDAHLAYPLAPRLEAYTAQEAAVLEVFTAASIPISYVDIAGTPVDVEGRIQAVVNPLFVTAAIGSFPGERAVVPPKVKSDDDEEEEDEEIKLTNRVGVTGIYSPVALRNNQVFAPGDSEISANYRGYNYWFLDEAEREQFLANPAYYTPRVPDLPPPHIAVFGPSGSEKLTYATLLSDHYGIPVMTAENAIKIIADQDSPVGARVLASLADGGSPDPALFAEALGEILSVEPFCSQGWILLDIANDAEQLDALCAAKIYPDIIISLELSEKYAILRTGKSDVELAMDAPKEEEDEDMTPEEKAEAAEIKRLERREAQEESIKEKLATEQSAIDSILESALAKRIRVEKVNSNLRDTIVVQKLHQIIHPVVQERIALLSNANACTMEQAAEWIRSGAKILSKFGYRCTITQLSEQGVAPLGQFPVQFGHGIYYLGSEELRKKFIRNPVFYVRQPPSKPFVPSKAFVLGPTHSGKTSLAKQMSVRLSARYLDAAEVIRIVMERNYSVGRVVKDALTHGRLLDNATLMSAVQNVLTSFDCLNEGWILDDLPLNMQQVEFLTKEGLIPHIVFDLQLGAATILSRTRGLRGDRIMPLPAAPRMKKIEEEVDELEPPPPPPKVVDPLIPLDHDLIIKEKLTAFWPNIDQILAFYDAKFRNVRHLDGECSKWWLQDTAVGMMETVNSEFQSAILSVRDGTPAALANLGVLREDVNARLSRHLGRFCPVCMATSEQLNRVEDAVPFSVYFQHEVYTTCSEDHMRQFIKLASSLSLWALPGVLPIHRSEAELPQPLELQLRGFCPISYSRDPITPEGLVYGSRKCVVEYDGKFFAMENEKAMSQFLKQPWRFHSLPEPTHNPDPPATPLKEAPIMEYMQRALAPSIRSALQFVSELRPKHPYIGPKESALKAVALHLKSLAPSLSEELKQNYATRKNFFEVHCKIAQLLDVGAGTGQVEKMFDRTARMGADDYFNLSIEMGLPQGNPDSARD